MFRLVSRQINWVQFCYGLKPKPQSYRKGKNLNFPAALHLAVALTNGCARTIVNNDVNKYLEVMLRYQCGTVVNTVLRQNAP